MSQSVIPLSLDRHAPVTEYQPFIHRATPHLTWTRLRSDLPEVDERCFGNLAHSASRILTEKRYSYRHSHFLPLHPALQQSFTAARTLPYHPSLKASGGKPPRKFPYILMENGEGWPLVVLHHTVRDEVGPLTNQVLQRKISVFGTLLEPRSFSAPQLSSSELLRFL